MKETYVNMDLLLKAISYSSYGWNICESGYARVCCFLCEWDIRAIDKGYEIKDWPTRENSFLGERFVRNQLLVDNDKLFFLVSLHIKLGFMKNFVKAVDKHGHCSEYLREKFLKTSDGKVKEGIFSGQQIH